MSDYNTLEGAIRQSTDNPICVFERYGKCKALAIDKCCGNCSFRKTPEQEESDRAKSYERLLGLSEKKQRHIADTYYRGKKMWEE